MGLRSKAVFPAALFILLIIYSSSSGAPPPEKSDSADGREIAIPDTVYYLPEIVVRAGRAERPEQLRSEFVACIELEGAATGRDIPSVLADAAGIRVRQYGGLGSYAAMSIRGSSSSQVQVYLDGVPLNDPYSGAANLADLAIGSIERIEIYRGNSPVSFGGSAIGGRINLIPERSLRNGPGIEFGAETGYGSFGSEKHSLEMSSSMGPVSLRLNGGYTESEGDFSFLDDNGTPETAVDDETVTRLNNDFNRWNFSGALGLDLPGVRRAAVNFDYFSRESGVCGIGSNQSPEARIERERKLAYIKLEPEAFLGKRIQTEATIFHSNTRERFDDPEGDIGLYAQSTDNSITSYGSSFRGTLMAPLLPLSTEIFVEGRKEQYHPVELLPALREGPDRNRVSATAAAAGHLSLFGDRVVLSGQYRTLWSENEFYQPAPLPYLPPVPRGKIEAQSESPQGGVRIRLSDNLTLKGNAGKYVRMPTFFELFGNIGTVTGNSNLEPEEGVNRDVGLILNTGGWGPVKSLFLEAGYFDNEISNLILFFPNSQRTVKPKNIGAARIRGAELTLSARLFLPLRISGNYTYMDAVDRSDIPYYNGNQLASTPSHEGSLRLALDRRGWSASWNLHYIGPNYLDKANMRKVPGRRIHSLAFSLKDISDSFNITLEGKNLAGNQIRDVIGYPLPGRSFFITLEFNREGKNNETDN